MFALVDRLLAILWFDRSVEFLLEILSLGGIFANGRKYRRRLLYSTILKLNLAALRNIYVKVCDLDMDNYFGRYERFETASKKDAAALLGADNLVGDVYDIDIEMVDGAQRAWLVSRFDARIGYFDTKISRKLSVLKAQGLTCKAILSFVAFTENSEEGKYWGDVAVICYNPAYAEDFAPFMKAVSKKLGEGVRPKVDLGADGADKIIESHGEWMPKQTVSYPDKGQNKGTAIIKRRRSVTDKLVEQGRAGNKGCYIVSWVFLLALVALIVYVVMKLL